MTTESSTLHERLDRAPEAISLTVRSLLQKVLSGEIRVPEFQRPLRWNSDDVVKLFDSILRGYPVGSLLFWKREAPEDPKYRVGGAVLPVPNRPNAWWIVDGQQRITALAAALLDLDHGTDRRWLVRYNPSTREFVSGALRPEETGRVVPLATIGDLRRLGRWLRDSLLNEEEQTHVEEVQQRILDYQLSAYLMETDRPAALQGVFARLNSTGVRMRSDEVFQALLGKSRPGRNELDLNRLQQSCDIDSFGQPPRAEVLKAVLAISGQDPTKRLEALGEDAASRLVDGSVASEALARAVTFLQAPPDSTEPGAGIPCYAFIPYPVVFLLLARWFHLFPETDALHRRLLAQWLWRAVISGTHQRAEVSKLRHQTKLVQGESLDKELSSLLKTVGEPRRVDWTLEPFHAHNARSRVELLALLSLRPSDKAGPVSWRALVSGGERVAREIIPSSRWKSLGEDERIWAKTAANRALHDARHTGLRAEFRTWNPVTDANALDSHLIDQSMWAALVAEEDGDFLRMRASRVQSLVSSFLTRAAGLGQPVFLPNTTYFDSVGTEETFQVESAVDIHTPDWDDEEEEDEAEEDEEET